MRIPDATLERLLKDAGTVTTAELAKLRLEQKRAGTQLQDVILKNKLLTEKELEHLSETAPKIAHEKTVHAILEYAVRAQASDIHIEPRETHIQVRYRIDGVLREVDSLPKDILTTLVTHIKFLSRLRTGERRVPQDGRFKMAFDGTSYTFRVSILPISDGEKVVIRVLDQSTTTRTLQQLGYWGQSLQAMQDATHHTRGLVLVAGPAGSGKSTTMYSLVSPLNSPAINIATVEDPVEYRINGANQTQVNTKSGMTFTDGLKAVLRQDPDVIMLSNIHDSQTADVAIQAAITGRLIFGAMNAYNAAHCLARLLDMNIEPFLAASAIRVVVGQRLARRLCSHCKQQYKPDADELRAIVDTFNLRIRDNIERMAELEMQAAKDGIGEDINNESSIKGSAIIRLWRAHPKGCDECSNTGYQGRISLYEVLTNNDEIQKLIIGKATNELIQDEAVSKGMVTLQMDGFIKALRGQTSIEEVLRTTRE